jgi:ABC-type dipeptide/oligopeptide/nickel transport system ATPase subunit
MPAVRMPLRPPQRGFHPRKTAKQIFSEALTNEKREEEKKVEEKKDFWAMVDLFGHQKVAGHVTEAEIGGCSLGPRSG